MGSRKELVGMLARMMQENLVWGVKAEFESEGTRFLELIELADIAREAGAKIAVKVGGPEAIRDLMELRSVGVDAVIAPMCESGYAVRKFSEACHRVFGTDEKIPEFFVNFETATSYRDREAIFAELFSANNIAGVVFGRVDFSLSSGLDRDETNSPVVLEAVTKVAAECDKLGKKFVVGGGVSTFSEPFLKEVAQIGLARFETRKVVFDSGLLISGDVESAILAGVHWEIAWLEYKRSRHQKSADEDFSRLEMLRSRWA